MKQAKIQLTVDSRGFRKQIDEAKGMLKTLGDANIPNSAGEKLKQIYGIQLNRALKQLDKDIKNTEKSLSTMSNASSKTFDAAKITTFTTKLDGLKKKYNEVKQVQDQLASGKMPEMSGAPAGGGIFGGMGKISRIGSMLSLAAGGMGIMSSFSRRERMADERLKIRSLSTDGQAVGETSALGFTPAERRARAAELAGATPATGEELTKLTDMGEQLERAYGIQDGQFAGAVGAARKAGIQDQGKFISSAIGMGRGAGLEGPQISEYLEAMTGYMAEMSKGINIDGASLTGFASALSTLPFFKNDPMRAFEALKSMDSAFKGGDEFQKAQAIRAIGMSAPGSSASSMEFRREMGLFGKIDPETLKNLKKAGVDTRAMETGGGELVNNIFKDVMSTTQGMNPNDQLFEFKKRTGLDSGAAASIFGQLKSGKPSMDKIQKELEQAAKSPEQRVQERLNDTYRNADGSIKSLNATLERVLEGIATNIAEPMTNLANKIGELIKVLGGSPEGIATGVGTAGVVGATAVGAIGTAAALGGGKAMAKGAATLGRGAMAVGKGAMAGGKALGGLASKVAPKAMGMMGGKMLSKLIPGVGLMMAGKDAWDVYEKYRDGKEISAKDWAVLSTSALAGVAGLFPGVGTAVSAGLGAASVGAELLPESAGGSAGAVSGASPSTASSNMGTMMSGGAIESDAALFENTLAIRDLTNALRMSPAGRAFADRYPSNAKFDNSSRPGKR